VWRVLQVLCPADAVGGLRSEDCSLVLSLHKLVADHARYYIDQAGERVDVVESIGDGVEEYYTGGTEARGQWTGAGARQLGLAGPIDGERPRAVLEGLDQNGEPLRDSSSAVRVARYDATFSAPGAQERERAVRSGRPRHRAGGAGGA
jgi:hypothetical protein